jgi:WXG100 family type VII secretion target
MTLISIAPPHAHDTAATLNASSRTLDGINSHLRRQWAALDAHWRGHSKGRVEGEVHIAFGQMSSLIEDTRDLGMMLDAIADRFEEADECVALVVQPIVWSSLPTLAQPDPSDDDAASG